ncbi:hypothetical protein CARUB_v10006624mg [Capsella rubella]|uniref:RRM domain-containing protein n=1 Tax=Capsella rubella TaxID=81985 RepID=R0F250_9BRAS|nr:hypothetical protein CARUB_v10006624mg [Capsella rubella]
MDGKRNPDDDDLETIPILKKHKETSSEEKETTEGLVADPSLLQKSDQANSISVKETVEGLDDTPLDFVEDAALIKNSLFIAHLPHHAKLPDIIDFFKDVGQRVNVRLAVSCYKGRHAGFGSLEFASAGETKKALEKKNGECLLDHKIILGVPKRITRRPPPKFSLDHKVWNEDCLRRECRLLEGDETPPDFAEAVSVRKTKTLFVAHLTPQTIISDIINFFKDVGQVVHIRLIVNNKGKHVGWGFVEFASAKDAEKVLYSLTICILSLLSRTHCFWYTWRDHKGPWYSRFEDHLRQESLLIEEDGAMDGFVETPHFVEEARKKTLFVTNLPPETKIKYITSFFKDVGKIVRVRLIADHTGKQVGCGFVEFASANEAEKALEQKYNLAEKLWLNMGEVTRVYSRYEDNLLREPNMKDKSNGFCGKKITFSPDED